MRVLVVTSEWPTPEHPELVPFIVRRVEALREAGIDVDVFSFKGARNPARYADAYRRVQAILRRQPYDVIHAEFGQSGLLVVLPKRRPLVVTFHGSDLQGIVRPDGTYDRPKSIISRNACRLVSLRADETILSSSHLAKYLPRKRFHVIPCGVDLDVFKPLDRDEARETLGICKDSRIILFAANPQRSVKRYWVAEQAVRLLDRSQRTELLVAGKVSHHQMPLYINAADVIILTSKHEGSPTIIKEALACNVPIVSVDVGDVRQQLAGVSGCVVCNSDDPAQIAVGLDTVLRAGARTNGRTVAESLDEKLLVRKVIKLYERVLR
jgi:teichuronic acid biosynthesis glycosyltransferase TuaC